MGIYFKTNLEKFLKAQFKIYIIHTIRYMLTNAKIFQIFKYHTTLNNKNNNNNNNNSDGTCIIPHKWLFTTFIIK